MLQFRGGFLWSVAFVVFVLAIAAVVPAIAKHHSHGVDLYVGDLSPGDDGAPPYECGTKEDPCDSLQHAVVHASDGDVLALANGTQTTGPVVIDKDLTIEGARGPVKSVLKPAADVEPGGAWLVVAAGSDVAWKMVTFDGAGRQVPEAIRYEGGGAVSESRFRNIAASGDQGTAISVAGGGLTVYKTEFSALGRSAVFLSGAGQPSLIAGSRFTGSGEGTEYGVEVEAGAAAEIRGNAIAGYSGPGGAAVAVRGAATATEAEIVANELRRSTVGLEVDGTGGEAVVAPRANAIVGNGTGLSAAGASVDARDNWWGCNGGPGSDGCDGTVGSAAAPTWLTLTLAASPREAPVAGTSNVVATLTRNSAGSTVAVPSLQPIESLESGRPEEEGVGPMGFADGTRIAFSASGGFLASPVTTVAGSAASTLVLVGPPGTATVKASLDAATASADVTVKQPETAVPPPASSPAASVKGKGNRLYGTRGNDLLDGLAGDDLLVGRAGNDRLLGRAGDDVAFGGAGGDLLLGQPGRDLLNGGPGNDLVIGGTGADFLVAGRGRDVLVAGAGADRLRAADGKPGDVVACGGGFDLAVADLGDTLSGCERAVLRSPRQPRAAGNGVHRKQQQEGTEHVHAS